MTEVKDRLVAGGKTHETAVMFHGTARHGGEQICRALSELLSFQQPAVQRCSFDVQRSVNLVGGALSEGTLCPVIANRADHADKDRHDGAHKQQLLFDGHGILPPRSPAYPAI